VTRPGVPRQARRRLVGVLAAPGPAADDGSGRPGDRPFRRFREKGRRGVRGGLPGGVPDSPAGGGRREARGVTATATATRHRAGSSTRAAAPGPQSCRFRTACGTITPATTPHPGHHSTPRPPLHTPAPRTAHPDTTTPPPRGIHNGLSGIADAAGGRVGAVLGDRLHGFDSARISAQGALAASSVRPSHIILTDATGSDPAWAAVATRARPGSQRPIQELGDAPSGTASARPAARRPAPPPSPRTLRQPGRGRRGHRALPGERL
jgi:hypothetical protein